jgi:glycosyltransferase involved in cell wall biosynthesis
MPVEWSFPSAAMGNLISFISRKNIFVEDILSKYDLVSVYPLHDFPVRTKTNTRILSWWADLQHKHYPEFFSKAQILGRNLRIRFILKNCDHLVLSSNDVHNDFKNYYRFGNTPDIYIYHFVSVIDNYDKIGIDDLRTKYDLPEEYFLVSNQFHKHKNHKVLLLALAKLNENGIRKNIVLTGKLPGASDSPYLAEIHKIIEDNKLEQQINTLGVISRTDQLQIMRHSQAVIQPSLFEGWSTVIEDAKSLQTPVIASNLSVNIEQLGDDGSYFNPNDPEELALIMRDFPKRNLDDVWYKSYDLRLREAAYLLLEILSNHKI